jgi:hypothetical protein
MATDKQIKANRQNAQKSTGPKTAGGKAAVSQNAIKHGLFTESVVTGETEAEYEAFHGELLAELAPRGVVELLLAERVVSLWWRLRRAERMQNQVIEDKIENRVTNPWAVSRREDHCYNEGLEPGDPRFEPEHLALGRIAISDWANCRIIDRMLLYERRIESSLNRAMKELKRFQTIRRIEWQSSGLLTENATQRRNKSFYKDPFMAEAPTRFSSAEDHGDLKKQSQFAMADIAASLYSEEGYDDISAGSVGENKAKRSQSRLAPRPALGVEKEKSVTAATG